MTKRKQRLIDGDVWQSRELLAAPWEARVTAMCLWGLVDDHGRMETRSDLIAGAVAPGNPNVTPEMIDGHLLELDECGFLTIYEDQGRSVLQLTRPLKTPRAGESDIAPAPLQEHSGTFLAVGRAGESASERARARVLREDAERTGEWAAWREGREQVAPPRRPLLLDAPPIGCPEHPNGTFRSCGPCRTARQQHERFIAQEIYTERLTTFEEEEAASDWDLSPI